MTKDDEGPMEMRWVLVPRILERRTIHISERLQGLILVGYDNHILRIPNFRKPPNRR